MQAVMAMMDCLQPHPIALKSTVLLETPEALMSSRYICGMSRPDTSHDFDQVRIRDGSGVMHYMRPLIDCGTPSIFMAPRLRTRVGLADELTFVTNVGLNGQVIVHARDSRMTAFTVHNMEHLSPVQESEGLVVPMRAYNWVLRLPPFQSRKPDVDWQRGQLLALRTPGGAEVVAVDQVHHQECPRNVPESTARVEARSEESGSIPDVHILGASAIDDLLASEQVIGTFFLRVGDCTGLLGATVEGITDGE